MTKEEKQKAIDAINKENKMTIDEALTLWLPVIKMGVKDMPECNEALDMAIKALSSEKLNMWIPVSEKLPSKRLPSDRKYIVTRADMIGRPTISMRYFKIDEYDFESKKDVTGWCKHDPEYGWFFDDKVTAWMPFLPEPYKEEGGK